MKLPLLLLLSLSMVSAAIAAPSSICTFCLKEARSVSKAERLLSRSNAKVLRLQSRIAHRQERLERLSLRLSTQDQELQIRIQSVSDDKTRKLEAFLAAHPELNSGSGRYLELSERLDRRIYAAQLRRVRFQERAGRQTDRITLYLQRLDADLQNALAGVTDSETVLSGARGGYQACYDANPCKGGALPD